MVGEAGDCSVSMKPDRLHGDLHACWADAESGSGVPSDGLALAVVARLRHVAATTQIGIEDEEAP
jgi:hypothetical protein